jgi:competence protein ComEC
VTSRRRIAELAAGHPRHVVLAVVVCGLLLGPRAPGSAIAAAVVALAGLALVVPPAPRAPLALALAAALLACAWAADARTAALDRTRLAAAFGSSVSGDATMLAAARADAFGGRRALVRWRGEPVLLRLPRWSAGAAPPVGAIVAVRGTLRAPDRTAGTLHAHAVLRAFEVRSTGRRRGGAPGVVDRIRSRAEGVLDRGLPVPEAALLRGMVLGEDDALPDDIREAFRAAGLSHLVAASGQNIMLLAALAVGLSIAAGLGIRARWMLVLALIAVYVPLAGAGPSIQRAGIMGAATVAAALAGRPASRWYALLLAAAVTLALDPRAAGDAGWQLSFAAVIGIALLAGRVARRLRRTRLPAGLAEAVAVTVAATLATAPLIAWRFDRTSVVGLPANVLAAPAVAPVMWLGMVAAAVGQIVPDLAAPLVAVAGLPLAYVVWLGRTAAGLPGAEVAVAAPVVTALAALLTVAVAGGPGGARGVRGSRGPGARRRVAFVVVAGLAAVCVLGRAAGRPPVVAPPASDALRVTAIDVGQGDATLVQADGHAVLVDAGPPGAPLLAGLARAGVRRLDALVVTHPQTDHDGGAPAVLARLPVDLMLDGRGGDRAPASLALDGPLRRRGTRIVAARAGDVLRAGRLRLRVLWPPPGPALPGTDPNDRAVVAVAEAFGARALLTADAESPVLDRLDPGPVDVLKVSHHGSGDPGLADLLARLQPRVALVEVGVHNTYGHPAGPTMAALIAAVPVVRRTDRDGTVRVDVRAGRVTVATTAPGKGAGV